MGKAERQARGQQGHGCLQEIYWSEADECSYAEEIVGVDEGAVDSEEKVESIVHGLNVAVRRLVYSRPPLLEWYRLCHFALRAGRVKGMSSSPFEHGWKEGAR